MTALLATGGAVLPIANDVELRSPYRARVLILAPQAPVSSHENGDSDTMLFVEEGMVELAVGGAQGLLGQGEFARIGAGVHYAFRNCTDRPARILSMPVVVTEDAPSAATVVVRVAA